MGPWGTEPCMTDGTPDHARDEPIEAVVRGTVGATDDETTRREALEQELEDRGRSEEGAGVEVGDVLADDDGGGAGRS